MVRNYSDAKQSKEPLMQKRDWYYPGLGWARVGPGQGDALGDSCEEPLAAAVPPGHSSLASTQGGESFFLLIYSLEYFTGSS